MKISKVFIFVSVSFLTLLVILLGYVLLSKNPFGVDKDLFLVGSNIKQQTDAVKTNTNGSKNTIYDHLGAPVPAGIKWDDVNKLTISGELTNATLNNRSLDINAAGKKVHIIIPSEVKKVSMYEAPNSTIQKERIWKAIPIEDFYKKLTLNRQILIFIDIDREESNSILSTPTDQKLELNKPIQAIL